MAVSLPYLASNKNLPTLFDKIGSAKVPDTFTLNFLQSTIGLKGSNDRSLIPFLRSLGFLDQSNVPTASYRLLKGEKKKEAWAQGIRNAYRPLFDADENADQISFEKLKSLVSQVAGTDDAATARIASTFSAAAKLGDFKSPPSKPAEEDEFEDDEDDGDETDKGKEVRSSKKKGLRPEFHYNIQVHLPSNGTEETYLNIFNAIRKTFQ
jgi:hypothetical protein